MNSQSFDDDFLEFTRKYTTQDIVNHGWTELAYAYEYTMGGVLIFLRHVDKLGIIANPAIIEIKKPSHVMGPPMSVCLPYSARFV